ncbi:MAG: TonB-dependent receptor, partial [Caulobacterales bacterium]
LNVYASYSTGFKSGGFQYVPFSKAQADTLFDPEDIKAYEVGLKSEWLDRRVRFNAAAFRYDYKDLQVSRIVLVGAAPISVITNAAASKITGLDLELNAKATDWLELNLGYGYLNAKYKNYIFNATQDFSDTRMVRAPKHTINAGAEIHFPVADGNVLLGADYSYLSKFFHEPGEGNVIYGPGVPLTVEKGYGLLNLRASYERGPLRFTVYGTNVTDENYRRTVNALGSSIVGFAGQPRIVGVKLGFTY